MEVDQSIILVIRALIMSLKSILVEFVMATISRQKLLSKERLEAAFKIFDKVIKTIESEFL